ncbi:MAG: RNA polymerase sigma factor [Phenylobacterium sp.]|nr:RNA polymerase sigma factor [Phenylobacterium sp.]MDO9246596.1 RNA polymerase sigma factor [Phenylobacterium sp.]
MKGPGEDVRDADLIRRALDGEDRAFTLLMRRYSGPLFLFIRRYVGAPDAAQDILQDSFVAAWSALDRYDTGRPLGAWLRAIALNKCRDRGRRLGLRRLILGDPESEEARRQPDPAPSGDEILLANERRATLEAAIAALPAKLKEPLLLTCFEGLSQQEAAEALGTTVKAIETRVYRARRRLSEALEHPQNE